LEGRHGTHKKPYNLSQEYFVLLFVSYNTADKMTAKRLRAKKTQALPGIHAFNPKSPGKLQPPLGKGWVRASARTLSGPQKANMLGRRRRGHYDPNRLSRGIHPPS